MKQEQQLEPGVRGEILASFAKGPGHDRQLADASGKIEDSDKRLVDRIHEAGIENHRARLLLRLAKGRRETPRGRPPARKKELAGQERASGGNGHGTVPREAALL